MAYNYSDPAVQEFLNNAAYVQGQMNGNSTQPVQQRVMLSDAKPDLYVPSGGRTGANAKVNWLKYGWHVLWGGTGGLAVNMIRNWPATLALGAAVLAPGLIFGATVGTAVAVGACAVGGVLSALGLGGSILKTMGLIRNLNQSRAIGDQTSAEAYSRAIENEGLNTGGTASGIIFSKVGLDSLFGIAGKAYAGQGWGVLSPKNLIPNAKAFIQNLINPESLGKTGQVIKGAPVKELLPGLQVTDEVGIYGAAKRDIQNKWDGWFAKTSADEAAGAITSTEVASTPAPNIINRQEGVRTVPNVTISEDLIKATTGSLDDMKQTIDMATKAQGPEDLRAAIQQFEQLSQRTGEVLKAEGMPDDLALTLIDGYEQTLGVLRNQKTALTNRGVAGMETLELPKPTFLTSKSMEARLTQLGLADDLAKSSSGAAAKVEPKIFEQTQRTLEQAVNNASKTAKQISRQNVYKAPEDALNHLQKIKQLIEGRNQLLQEVRQNIVLNEDLTPQALDQTLKAIDKLDEHIAKAAAHYNKTTTQSQVFAKGDRAYNNGVNADEVEQIYKLMQDHHNVKPLTTETDTILVKTGKQYRDLQVQRTQVAAKEPSAADTVDNTPLTYQDELIGWQATKNSDGATIIEKTPIQPEGTPIGEKFQNLVSSGQNTLQSGREAWDQVPASNKFAVGGMSSKHHDNEAPPMMPGY